MAIVDSFGNVMTTEHSGLAQDWNELVEHVLAHGAQASSALGRVLAADPSFALGHAIKGLMLLSLARSECAVDAAACLAKAQLCISQRAVTPRELAYVDALAFWIEGDPQQAANLLETTLALHPRDALAFKFSHGIRFIMGEAKAMLRCAYRHAHGFAGTTAYGYVLGCLAFAQEENHDFELAEQTGRHAIALQPRDAWGRHAVAHVMEMTGRSEEGSRWLRGSTESWQHCNNFSYHIYWHLALFELELGRTRDVLDLYDREIRANRTDDYRDLANGASLLARLELEGIDVGNRWDELADIASQRAHDHRLVFADLHYLMALLGAGETSTGEALVRTLRQNAQAGHSHNDRVAAAIGETAAEGIMAFHAADYRRSARLMGHALPRLQQIGGSDAQRDIFEQVAIESYVRSGDVQRACELLSKRLRKRRGHNAFASKRLNELAEHASSRRSSLPNLRFGALAIASTAVANAH
ncbi:MAG: tetratricopeptide repeat protein [Beijerinckiaceae bacterium]